MNTLDDVSTCCDECFSPSHDTNFGYGDVAVPDACMDTDCDCHEDRFAVAADTDHVNNLIANEREYMAA